MLFQFGKSFTRTPITLQRLDDLGTYLTSQCSEGRFAIEFRHPSWFDEDGWVGGRQELLTDSQRLSQPCFNNNIYRICGNFLSAIF